MSFYDVEFEKYQSQSNSKKKTSIVIELSSLSYDLFVDETLNSRCKKNTNYCMERALKKKVLKWIQNASILYSFLIWQI